MAIVTLPADLKISKLSFGRNTYDLMFANADTGASSTRLLGPPRWTLSFSSASDMTLEEASAWEAFLLRLGGRQHHLEAWDVARPAPRGTLRGVLNLVSLVKEGDTSATITGGAGQVGRTLLPGDRLQIGTGIGTSQLVAVVEPAAADASGTLTFNFQSPARTDYSAGLSVTWDKAKAYFKANSGNVNWSYERANEGGFSFDGTEQWHA